MRWGIAGTGGFASSVAATLEWMSEAELVAIASSHDDELRILGDLHGVPLARRYSSYEALAADDGVDLIYVATPASHHFEHTVLFLTAGRGVVCETPFGLNEAQAAAMVAAVRAEGRFLMETSTRNLPVYVRLRELMASGAIGKVVAFSSDYGYAVRDRDDPWLDPARGGGALLHQGVYPLSLASMLLGTPGRVTALGEIGDTGIDEHVAVLTGHSGGVTAAVTVSLRTHLARTACVSGTRGSITVPGLITAPTTLVVRGGDRYGRLDLPFDREGGRSVPGSGFHHQVRHVHRRLHDGHLDSDVMPLDESQSIMRTLDTVRAQIGARPA